MSILDRSILVDSICGVVIRKGATVITVMAETVPAAKGTAVQIQFRSYFGYNTHTCFIYVSWLVVWNMFLFFHILGRIIPTDFHIFFRGVGIPPTSIYIHINIYTPQLHLCGLKCFEHQHSICIKLLKQR